MTVVASELRALYDANGRLIPQDVVDAARAPEHVLHDRFEWDDAVAGEAHRRAQAGRMIRQVRVEFLPRPDADPMQVRAFVAIPAEEADEDEPASSYYPQEVVAASQALSAIAARQMERRWRELRRAYSEHQEFWELLRREVSAQTEAA